MCVSLTEDLLDWIAKERKKYKEKQEKEQAVVEAERITTQQPVLAN